MAVISIEEARRLAGPVAQIGAHLGAPVSDLPHFDVSGTDDSGLKREYTIAAADGFAAVCHGLEGGLNGVVAHPHPREMTYEQGKARHPRALRPDAFVDAWRGWYDAQAEARAARLARGLRDDSAALERSYDWALVAQIQSNPQHWI